MNTVWKGDICEIIDIGKLDPLRLYCEGISGSREDHIISYMEGFGEVRSKSNNQIDGSLMIDFERENIHRVMNYFGDRHGF
jgi:hypothetical protein